MPSPSRYANHRHAGPAGAMGKAFDAVVEVLRGLGAALGKIELPPLALYSATASLITRGEGFAIYEKTLRERPQDYRAYADSNRLDWKSRHANTGAGVRPADRAHSSLKGRLGPARFPVETESESAFQLYAHQRDHCAANSVEARDRAVVRGGAIAEVEHDLIEVTPPPAFGWVIAFDDWMARLVKMLGGVAVRRVVATADMAAGPA